MKRTQNEGRSLRVDRNEWESKEQEKKYRRIWDNYLCVSQSNGRTTWKVFGAHSMTEVKWIKRQEFRRCDTSNGLKWSNNAMEIISLWCAVRLICDVTTGNVHLFDYFTCAWKDSLHILDAIRWERFRPRASCNVAPSAALFRSLSIGISVIWRLNRVWRFNTANRFKCL